MVVISSNNEIVELIKVDRAKTSNRYVIVDQQHRVWFRTISVDKFEAGKPNLAGFTTGFSRDGQIWLNPHQLSRVCEDDLTNNDLDTFLITLPPKSKEILLGFGHETVTEVLWSENPKMTLFELINAEAKIRNITYDEETSLPLQKKPPRAPSRPHPTKKSSRSKLQPGGLEKDIGGVHVLMTPKQVEFMERMSEYPGFSDITGEFYANTYVDELSDTMSAMVVGAVITTLREKGILTTKSVRMDGCKTSQFKYTELGVEIYKLLSEGQI